MKALFTIHEGEYLVGNRLERDFSDFELWLPSKDTGIDLLISEKDNPSNCVTIQVKHSKDYKDMTKGLDEIKGVSSCGWWKFGSEKIDKSRATVWVLSCWNIFENKLELIMLEKDELLSKLESVHTKKSAHQLYLWFLEDGRCIDVRDLNIAARKEAVMNHESYPERDFTEYVYPKNNKVMEILSRNSQIIAGK